MFNLMSLRPAHILQLCVVALLGLAVVMVHSAGMTVGSDHMTTFRGLMLSRHVLYAVIAVGAMFFASRINVRHALTHRGVTNPLLIGLAISLTLVGLTMLPGVGRNVNGSTRWLAVGPITFQPSELVKWVMVLAVAWWCARRRGVMHRFAVGLVPVMVLVALSCGLIVIEDLGTAVLIGAVAVCLVFAGGARFWHLATLVPAAGGALVAAILHSPYRMARLTAFIDPWADPRGNGYHPIQSMLAIAQGQLLGRGLGNGIQKFGYVPADTTDFIFSVICEELGIAGALLVIALYLVILWTGLRIVRDCKDTFARLVALGVVLTVTFQAIMNIAVVCVVVPTKGIALPLLSAGGTGWILTAFALGLVAALDEANRVGEVEKLPELEPAMPS